MKNKPYRPCGGGLTGLCPSDLQKGSPPTLRGRKPRLVTRTDRFRWEKAPLRACLGDGQVWWNDDRKSDDQIRSHLDEPWWKAERRDQKSTESLRSLCEGLLTSHNRSTEGLLFVFLAFARTPPDENEKKFTKKLRGDLRSVSCAGQETRAQRGDLWSAPCARSGDLRTTSKSRRAGVRKPLV